MLRQAALTLSRALSRACQQSSAELGPSSRSLAACICSCSSRAACSPPSTSGRPAPAWQPLRLGGARGYAAQPAPDDEETRDVGSERVRKLVDEIVALNLLEVADLTELLRQKLGIDAMPGGMFGGMGGGGGAAPAAAAPAEEKKEEQTEFDVKLDGFEAAAKIKVIKEVRGVLPELGLKEAKELVEKSPAVLKKGMKKEDAEALKKKLEAVGAKVSIE